MVKKRKGVIKAGKREPSMAAAEGYEESDARDSETYDRADFLELEEDDRLGKWVNGARKTGGAGPDRVQEIFPLSDDEDVDLPRFVGKAGNLDDILDEAEDEEDVRGFGWGKKRRHFYGGNPNDGGGDGKDGELDEAEAEAQESKAVQTKQLEDLDEEDFLDVFVQTETKRSREDEKKPGPELDLDLTKMSRREKLDLFHRESPEFEGIAAEFLLRIEEGKKLQLIVDAVKSGRLPADTSAAKYAVTKHGILINYLTNISAYLMFKTRRSDLKFHPITARLVRYKRILDRMPDGRAETVIEKASRFLKEGRSLKSLTENKAEKRTKKKREKKLKIMNEEEEEEKDEGLTYDERKAVEMYEETRPKTKEEEEEEEEEEEMKEEETKEEKTKDEETKDEEEDEKRAITYQMAKNKGLKPKRSKLQRNPRVKHRVKFEKAKKRRKGQVREVRKEVKKYAGEHSGINVRVKKGIKLM